MFMDSLVIHLIIPDQEFLNHSGKIAERAKLRGCRNAELRNVS